MTADQNLEEQQYLDLCGKIISHGNERKDRTGTGTKSIFAPPQLRFNLQRFPLLTTKRMSLRIIFEELRWFIRGETDCKILQNRNVHIWDGNGSKEALEALGLDYEEGDLGPVYGFQWRHFGAEYVDCHTDYSGKGVDQLRQCISSILFAPYDRRIILSAWNPSDLHRMALPPCHMTCQFYVNDNRLSCQLYQRSCDIGLGVPFNIASYALFTSLIAYFCGLEVGEFIHCMGDAHVYNDHIEPLKEQIQRTPMKFPILKINKPRVERNVTAVIKALEEIEYGDIELIDYNSHGRIKMDMSV